MAGGHGLQCVQAIEAAKVAVLELPATIGFWDSENQPSSKRYVHAATPIPCGTPGAPI